MCLFYTPHQRIYTYIFFSKPSRRVGCDTRSVLKQSLTDLNFEISFYTDRHTMDEGSSQHYFFHGLRENERIGTILLGISAVGSTIRHIQGPDLGSRIYIYIYIYIYILPSIFTCMYMVGQMFMDHRW